MFSNEQVALMAAADGRAGVLERADEYLAWLHAQQVPTTPGVTYSRGGAPIPQCESVSLLTGFRCLRPGGHAGEHRNSMGSVTWGD